MTIRKNLLLLFMFTTVVSAGEASAALLFHFEDEFTAPEQAKLTTWVAEVAAGVERLVGPYPFDVHIYFARARASEPVPWANTMRGREQGVRFHVDTRHSLGDFRRDWTAPHELSHLILPYLGRSNAWFAEGFASYMQHQVMHATGALTREATARRYQRRLDEASRQYKYPDRPFVELVPKLRAEGRFPVMYWGGAVYFLRLDESLKAENDTSLIAVLAAYLRCCRRHRDDIDSLIAHFDRLLGAEVCARELDIFRRTPGFPEYGQIGPGVVNSVSVER